MRTGAADERRAVALVGLGQLCFVVFIGVCVALHPGFVLKRNEGGISNYGPHLKTAVAYSIALLGLAELSRRAGASLGGGSAARRLRHVLYFYFVIVLIMLVTSYVYTLDSALRDVHFAFGTLLIVFEVVSSWWMLRLTRRLWWDGVFWAIQLVGSILCLVTIAGALHVLFVGEMVTWAGFAGLLIDSTDVVVRSPSRVRDVEDAPDSSAYACDRGPDDGHV